MTTADRFFGPTMGGDAEHHRLLQSLGDQGAAAALKLRMARVVKPANDQTIATSTETTVGFGSPQTIEWDDLSIEAADELADIWDTSNHQWLVPADATYVSLYGEIKTVATTAAGGARMHVLQSYAAGGSRAWSYANMYAPASGFVGYLTVRTPFISVEAGDTFELVFYQAIQATLDLQFDSQRFQLEIVER